MNIVGLELESSRAQLVKLKKEKEELTSELGQGKVVLDSMQATIYKAESRLQGLLVAKSTINLTILNKQNMICEFYKSIMEKTKFDHEEYY
jgi:chromosome segregation ATPase